ncbi:uncharacterized protein Z518_05895 [Rhinocladiella mackenziei CBS 650.93]|uniref:Uncharacterized protein n=1 Tax=Rhinocladiella mackenziei CBS 650.93 TaxID=1442369 RepID=A0A0D2H3R4_9EURO|nr:uncharacterized protein Z518_05895 [Rhinocladiella mackenziei CBS 650.93]KIX05023.1 hypothetical protein Z518_05895 [Rhinocladiella mackenziei CBS 650.93]
MDLDETMTTSTISTPSAAQDTVDIDETYEDDNLYPDSHGDTGSGAMSDRPRTPANDHLNAAAPGELSPPRSQTQGEDVNRPMVTPMSNGGYTGATNTATTRGATRSHAEPQFEGSREEGLPYSSSGPNERDERPGWGWKNKKAQEDMQRAMDNVVDRDFSLKEFGDVILLGKAQMAQQ